MTAPVALQLYTLRLAAQEDFEGIVRKVAEIGYVGVETAGFPGTTVEALGITRIVAGLGPDQFASIEQIKESCDKFNEASANSAEKGFTFGIHNHWWEFQKVEGDLVLRHMLDHLSSDIFFEVDVYWAQTVGADPAGAIAELGGREELRIPDRQRLRAR